MPVTIDRHAAGTLGPIRSAAFRPGEDPLGTVVDLFDAYVDSLRTPATMPNPAINRVMTAAWRLIGRFVTPLALIDDPAVATMGFALVRTGGGRRGAVAVPPSWVAAAAADRWLQGGAVVLAGAHAVVYAQDPDGYLTAAAHRIALAYEAEYLRTLRGEAAIGLTLTAYQARVLEHHPKGLASLPRHLRPAVKPIAPGDFNHIDEVN